MLRYRILLLPLFMMLFSCVSSRLMSSGAIALSDGAFPAAWSEEPVIILSDSTGFLLDSREKGNAVRTFTRTVYLVRRQNPDLLRNITVIDNESLEEPPAIKIAVNYADGTRWSWTNTNKDRSQLQSVPGYSSNQYVQGVTLPRYKQGMIITQTVERLYRRPEFLSVEVIRQPFPSKVRTITIASPGEGGIDYHLANEEQLPVDSLRSSVNGRTLVRFVVHDLEKIDDVDLHPEPEQWLAALYFSFPAEGATSFSWERMGDHYLSSLQDASSGSERLDDALRRIGAGPPDSLVESILYFIRNRLRYQGNFEGIHGFVPHTISSILDNGYGDCKDMSLVGLSMARRLGLPVGLVLVNAGDGFQAHPSIPTLGTFNHVMLYFDRPDGTRLVVDPTSTFGRPLESGFHAIGKKALFLKEHGSFPDTISRPASFHNTVTTRSTVTLHPKEAVWKLEGTVTLCGYVAMRLYPDFRELSAEQRMPVIRNYLRQFFEIDAGTASLDRLDADTIVVRYDASFQENYLDVAKGGFLLNKPSLFGGDVRFTTLTYPGPRFFAEIEQNDTWRLPGKFRTLEKENLISDIASGTWTIEKNSITRRFMQKRSTVNSNEASRVSAMKNAFLKATVWK